MQECNSPRNSRSQTHQDDERPGGEAVMGFALRPNKRTHRIDRSAHASKTQELRLARLCGAPAAVTGSKAGGGC